MSIEDSTNHGKLHWESVAGILSNSSWCKGKAGFFFMFALELEAVFLD